MTQDDLLTKVAEEADISKAAARRALDALAGTIVDVVKNGDSVKLSDIGTFSRSERAARTGRNPQSGETINIPASAGIKFKMGKAAKDALNP